MTPEEERLKRAAYMREYRRQGRAKEVGRRYWASAKGRATKHRYNNSAKGHEAARKHRNSDGGKIMRTLNSMTPHRRLTKALWAARRAGV